MDPQDFHRDPTWRDLVDQVAVAGDRVSAADAAVRRLGADDGRGEALTESDQDLKRLRRRLREHEQLLLNRPW